MNLESNSLNCQQPSLNNSWTRVPQSSDVLCIGWSPNPCLHSQENRVKNIEILRKFAADDSNNYKLPSEEVMAKGCGP